MTKRARGEVLTRDWKAGRGFALRFFAYGRRRYVTLGYERDGWTLARAEEELENTLADVRRGLWVPSRRAVEARGEEEPSPPLPVSPAAAKSTADASSLPAGEVLFADFASWLMKVRRARHGEAHHANLKWGLRHLMPFFAEWWLREIDAEGIDMYSTAKVEEGERLQAAIDRSEPLRDERGRIRRPLAAGSINKTIKILSWFLGLAVQYKRASENAAAGKERLLRARPKPPVYLDTAEQIEALLDAAAELDRDPAYPCCDREAIVATLIFAGPRAHELGYLLERDLDLVNDRIFVGRSKTAAGIREIRILKILKGILAAHKARAASPGPDLLAFATGTGGRRDRGNLRERVLKAVFERADRLLRERGQLPLPVGLTPHKLRHTFASILVAIGKDPTTVMRQLGHKSAAFTLEVYAHMMDTTEEQRERLKALVEGKRRWGPAPPPRLGAPIYKRPILDALVAAGGTASRSDVLAAVEKKMSDRFGLGDTELVGGQPRWQADVDVARRRLLEVGLIAGGEREGIWRLTKAGTNRVLPT